MFYTRYELDKRSTFHSCPGSPIKRTYGTKYDDNGRLVTYETGKTDLNAKIQIYKDSCDLNLMMKRYVENGDASVLEAMNVKQGMFGDFTQMPNSYMECLNLIKSGEDFFNSLPVSIREQFGFDFGRFASAIGTPEFAELMKEKDGANNDVAPEPNAEVLPEDA